MDTRPEPPPEGRLIKAGITRADISIREAARRAGISYGRWRQIVEGYQNVAPGVYAPVRNAPARTVARMARAAGVTPAQLAAEGRRPDAAAILAGLLAEDEPAPPAAPSPAGGAADEMALRIGEAIIATIGGIADGIRAEIARRRGAGVPEDRIFTDPGEQAMWALPLMPEEDRILRVAWLRAMHQPRSNNGEPPVELAG